MPLLFPSLVWVRLVAVTKQPEQILTTYFFCEHKTDSACPFAIFCLECEWNTAMGTWLDFSYWSQQNCWIVRSQSVGKILNPYHTVGLHTPSSSCPSSLHVRIRFVYPNLFAYFNNFWPQLIANPFENVESSRVEPVRQNNGGPRREKKRVLICTRNFRSTPAKGDEIVQMRIPQLLVFSSVHPISKNLYPPISKMHNANSRWWPIMVLLLLLFLPVIIIIVTTVVIVVIMSFIFFHHLSCFFISHHHSWFISLFFNHHRNLWDQHCESFIEFCCT